MVNINNKPWDKLRAVDIKKYLDNPDSCENFFFEYKEDEENTQKFAKEVSAFANTYGGYVLLGVDDDKHILGCTQWTEQRIHTTIHDSLTPTPNFDVKRFILEGKKVLIVKIEEGIMPPYMTNDGKIYERISSGSFPVSKKSKSEKIERTQSIKDLSALNLLYEKRKNQLEYIRDKIELPIIKTEEIGSANLFAYLDFGFSVVMSDSLKVKNKFYNANLEKIGEYLRTFNSGFSISKIGTSYLFSVGTVVAKGLRGNRIPAKAGQHDFMEVMCDGSVRGRVLLMGEPNAECINVTMIIFFMDVVFPKIYSMIFGEQFYKLFVHAHKYEKFTVVKQFVPIYDMSASDSKEIREQYAQYLPDHKKKYGNNIMIIGGRFPRNDYLIIDQQLFNNEKIKYNAENLYKELFRSMYANLGYIDAPAMVKD